MLLTDFVGFTAYATISSQTPASGDVIALPGVVTNAGDAYNPDNSTFTCPTTAYYYIYVSLTVRMRDTDYYYCHIDITMDDLRIVEVRQRDKCSDDEHFVSGKAWALQSIDATMPGFPNCQLCDTSPLITPRRVKSMCMWMSILSTVA